MARPISRQTLIEYCLRSLGDPVIEINVDPEQIEDRIDEAIEFFREFHADATVRTFLKHQLTDSDLTNGYIPVSDNISDVISMFPIDGAASSTGGMFNIHYQLRLNDFATMSNFMGDLAYYEQMQQYLSLIDMKLKGTPQVDFSINQRRLYIHGDLVDGDLVSGDYVVAEAYTLIDPDTFTSIYNNKWLKEYATALIKRQWGSNLIKFEGMQLPGGVTLNGRQIFDDAQADIEKLREDLRLEHELPINFFVG